MKLKLAVFCLSLFFLVDKSYCQNQAFISINGSLDLPVQGNWKTGYGADVTFGKQSKIKKDAFTVSLSTHHFNFKSYDFINQVLALRIGYQFFPGKNFYIHPAIGIQRQFLNTSGYNPELAWGIGVGVLSPIKKGALNSFAKLYGGKSNLTWISIGLGYQFYLGSK